MSVKVRIVIVDDSPLFREVMRELVQADGDIVVAGEAASSDEAFARITALAPDLVTVDIGLGASSGLDLIERVMTERPMPLLVVTGQPAAPGSALAFDAIRRGALDIVAKAALSLDGGAAARGLIRRLALVPVVRHVPVTAWRAARTAPRPPPALGHALPCRVVAMAASSGGPSAVVSVLGELPATFPACVPLVQHLPIGFVESFARFLSEHLRLTVTIVKARTPPARGTVLLPPDDHHLVITSAGLFVPLQTPPVGGHRPSATPLFQSVARVCGASGVGVMLTGMGEDGVPGLGELRRAGGVTVAEDESTAAIFGMPKAAIEAGAAEHVVALHDIAPFLERIT
jgi:two-component system chemotaxis response regulator CheB